jgi:hypothetical protein
MQRASDVVIEYFDKVRAKQDKAKDKVELMRQQIITYLTEATTRLNSLVVNGFQSTTHNDEFIWATDQISLASS